jgi:phage gp16-like protein
MNASTASLARDPRKGRYAIIQIGRKELGLDEDTYRDLLHDVTGKRSVREMTLDQLDAVIDRMKADGFKPKPRAKRQPARAGTRPMDTSPLGRKMRALWLAGYHLGVIRDPKESALAAFAKRQTGVPALQWLVDRDAERVIEALKDMLAREAGVLWPLHRRNEAYPRAPLELLHDDRYWVVRAQFEVLCDIREARTWISGDTKPTGWARWAPDRFVQWSDGDWTQLMEGLGRKIRRAFEDKPSARDQLRQSLRNRATTIRERT